MSELGKLLRKLRGKESLREVAARANISHSYLNTIEKGKDPRTGAPVYPTPETLKSLSIAYNYSYDNLMRLAGYTKDEDNVMRTWTIEDIERSIQNSGDVNTKEFLVLLKQISLLPEEEKQIMMNAIRLMIKK